MQWHNKITHARARAHVRTHAHTHAHTHTHARTHARTHTHARTIYIYITSKLPTNWLVALTTNYPGSKTLASAARKTKRNWVKLLSMKFRASFRSICARCAAVAITCTPHCSNPHAFLFLWINYIHSYHKHDTQFHARFGYQVFSNAMWYVKHHAYTEIVRQSRKNTSKRVRAEWAGGGGGPGGWVVGGCVCVCVWGGG